MGGVSRVSQAGAPVGEEPRTERRAAGPVLGAERREQVRMAAETMVVGVLFTLFSLPLVTAGAAWCAAAEVTAGWHRGEEPPLLRTFARIVRRELRAGLLVQAAVLAVVALTWFEVRVVLAVRLPGYPVESAALVAVGTCAVAFILLTVAQRAARAGAWTDAVRGTALQVRRAPGALVLVVAAGGCTGALVAMIPAFAGFMAGPLAYAVSAVVAREGARRARALVHQEARKPAPLARTGRARLVAVGTSAGRAGQIPGADDVP